MEAWQTAEWLDGPKFVEWFESVRPNRGKTPEVINRRLYDCRTAARPIQVWTVDAICVRYGLHLRDIPEDVWLPGWRLKRRRVPASTKAAILREYETGIKATALSREYGVSPSIISRWVRQEIAA